MEITFELSDLGDDYFEHTLPSREEARVLYESSTFFKNHASDIENSSTASDFLAEFRSKFTVNQIFLINN